MMNLSASLTRAEIDALSAYDNKALRDAEQDLRETSLRSNTSEESTFERSLRIKNTLDALEAATKEPSKRALSIFINGEYQLWRLGCDIPLQNNPFLCHWVEAIQRLDRREYLEGRASSNVVAGEVDAVRVLWIKTLLQQNNLKRWEDRTPQNVVDALVAEGLGAPFDVRRYIEMLEDEGIYEKKAEPQTAKPAALAQRRIQVPVGERLSPLRISEQSPEEKLQKQKDGILQKLEKHHDAAILEITRLPIAIPYLDFLTTLLADRTLEKHSIDPAPVVTQYIQHALRSIERAERPPSPSGSPEMASDGRGEHNREVEYGKDAQTRYIRLLLLFIKSLIRKGLVELGVLYYEISEITVRYVWIKEVRDFKRWAEEGVEQDWKD